MKSFHKIPLFFKWWLPLVINSINEDRFDWAFDCAFAQWACGMMMMITMIRVIMDLITVVMMIDNDNDAVDDVNEEPSLWLLCDLWMYSRLSQTSFKTLEDCSHFLQLPVRQHVRVVCHVGAHPHLDQQSHTTPLLAPAPQNKTKNSFTHRHRQTHQQSV